jgi:Protein of unknown function (DUF3426).
MADSITQCPKCGTSFRITQAHLSSARGAVRCGSCLNIFNAKDYLQAPSTKAQPASSTTSKSTTNKALTNKPKPKAPAKPQAAPVQPAVAKAVEEKTPSAVPSPLEDDDILISDDMDSDEDSAAHDALDNLYGSDFNSNVIYSKNTSNHESNLFERDYLNEADDEPENTDETWALGLLDSNDDEMPQLRKDNTGHHKAVVQSHLDAAKHDNNDVYPNNEADSDDDDSDYSSSAYTSGNYGAADYATGAHEAIEDAESYANNSDEDYLDDSDSGKITRRHEPTFTDAGPSLSELEGIIEGETFDSKKSSNQQFIHAIEPEPVEFSYKSTFSLAESKLFWGALALLAAVLLLAQIAWLKFDKLSRIEPYRQYYTEACHWLNCELPALIDRKKIRAVNLIVRSHPDTAGVLAVDAVLQNAAEFPQTFPSLDLIFTNSKGQPVAARRFRPSEYLGGELANLNTMPAGQPIHIAIEILDPGTEAVGYKINIAE